MVKLREEKKMDIKSLKERLGSQVICAICGKIFPGSMADKRCPDRKVWKTRITKKAASETDSTPGSFFAGIIGFLRRNFSFS